MLLGRSFKYPQGHEDCEELVRLRVASKGQYLRPIKVGQGQRFSVFAYVGVDQQVFGRDDGRCSLVLVLFTCLLTRMSDNLSCVDVN